VIARGGSLSLKNVLDIKHKVYEELECKIMKVFHKKISMFITYSERLGHLYF